MVLSIPHLHLLQTRILQLTSATFTALRQSGDGDKIGVKFNKFEFLKFCQTCWIPLYWFSFSKKRRRCQQHWCSKSFVSVRLFKAR